MSDDATNQFTYPGCPKCNLCSRDDECAIERFATFDWCNVGVRCALKPEASRRRRNREGQPIVPSTIDEEELAAMEMEAMLSASCDANPSPKIGQGSSFQQYEFDDEGIPIITAPPSTSSSSRTLPHQTEPGPASPPSAVAEEPTSSPITCSDHDVCTAECGLRARYGATCTWIDERRYVLFGGTDYDTTYDDVWCLDENKGVVDEVVIDRINLVTGEEIPHPEKRFGHSMHRHPSGKVVLFGGCGQNQTTFYNDMWILDIDARVFRQVEANGGGQNNAEIPKPRRNHTIVNYKDHSILYGGHNGGETFGDVWILDKDLRWKKVVTCGSTVQSDRELKDLSAWSCDCDAPDPSGCNYVYPFSLTSSFTRSAVPSGSNSFAASNASLAANRLKDGDEPAARYCHTSVVVGDLMYVFGGQATLSLAEPKLWSLNLNNFSWKRHITTGKTPVARFGHTVVLTGADCMVLFGGMRGFPRGETLNDVHILDLATRHWYAVGCGGALPKPRRMHSMCVCGTPSSGSKYDEVLIFGGWAGGKPFGDFFKVSLSAPKLKDLVRRQMHLAQFFE